MGVYVLELFVMNELLNILIDRMDNLCYADYCRMMHVLYWNC